MKSQEIISTVIPSMVLAPSAHNTQPWKFKVDDGRIDVFIEWDRHLSVSDPTERELYVSIGCAILNAKVAAADAGFSTDVRYFQEGQGRDLPVVRIKLTEGSIDETLKPLHQAITRRRTNRLLYDAELLAESERESLSAISTSEMVVLGDKGKMQEIADVSARGTFSTLSRKEFKGELSQWVRNSWTKKPDGMPGYAMRIPALVSLVAPMMVRVAPIHKQESKSVKEQIESSSVVVVIVTERDQREDWMRAGELLEKVWLQATAIGLAACTHAAAIEASEETRGEVRKIINTRNHPQAILRIGHAPTIDLKATPRRTVDDCLVKA